MMLLLTRSSCFWPLRLQPSACHFVHVHYQPRTKTNLRLWFSRPFSSGSCTVVSAVQSAVVEGTAVVLLFVVDPLSLVTPESTTLKSPVITGLDFTGLNFTGLNLTGLDFTGHHSAA